MITILKRLFVCCVLAAPAYAQSDASRELHRLFEERFEWQKKEFPEFAMSLGDYAHADRITDNSLEAIERRHNQTRRHLERLASFNRAQLNDGDQLNYDLFEHLLRDRIEAHGFRAFLAPINSRSGPHHEIPQMHERVRFDTADDFANYLKRLEQVPRAVEHAIAKMRLGLREGRTPPQVTLQGTPEQFERLTEGGLRVLAEPFKHMPSSIDQAKQTELTQRFENTSFPAVRKAIASLGNFVSKEYLPHCRTTLAAHDLPDGQAYYAFLLRHYTTTELSAQQIHDLGLAEVQRIKQEMMQVIRASDFMERPDASSLNKDQDLFRAFIQYLRTDRRFYHTTEEDLLRGYRDICKRVDAQLPKLFRTLPRLTYGVRKVPDFMAPTQTTAYYQRGNIENAEPGYFYANTYALDQRPKYEMIALTLHEAVPGHHFQVARAAELEDLPEFRKHAWFTAFGEGWALYAERLGTEMGFYADSYDDFGRLLYEMWRACRLVVDTGVHALGWSREKAIGFMLDNTALSELNIANEVDRYISWPAQATAYKIGELRIRELRANAERALGAGFDVRGFHDVVLGAGSVPLTVLEKRVQAWTQKQRKKSK